MPAATPACSSPPTPAGRLQGRIPIYLRTSVGKDLERENPFVLEKKGQSLALYFLAPLYLQVPPAYIFAIEFSSNAADLARARDDYIDFITTLFFILIAFGLAAAIFSRNRILAPIHQLNQGMREVEKGNLQPLSAVPSEIELRSLYLGFNAMIEGIREQRENISELARMKTMIQLGRRVAHEVKNPLTPIKLSAEQIQRSLDDKSKNYEETVRRAVRFIIEETEHLRKVSYGFLDLSKLDELHAEAVDLADLVRQEVEVMGSLFPRMRFDLELPVHPLSAVIDRLKIKQALRNLLNNAVEALAGFNGAGRQAWTRA